MTRMNHFASIMFMERARMNQPNKFIFHEAYTGTDAGGKEGFEAHCATAHFGKWQELMEIDPFTEAPVVNNFKTLQ